MADSLHGQLGPSWQPARESATGVCDSIAWVFVPQLAVSASDNGASIGKHGPFLVFVMVVVAAYMDPDVAACSQAPTEGEASMLVSAGTLSQVRVPL